MPIISAEIMKTRDQRERCDAGYVIKRWINRKV